MICNRTDCHTYKKITYIHWKPDDARVEDEGKGEEEQEEEEEQKPRRISLLTAWKSWNFANSSPRVGLLLKRASRETDRRGRAGGRGGAGGRRRRLLNEWISLETRYCCQNAAEYGVNVVSSKICPIDKSGEKIKYLDILAGKCQNLRRFIFKPNQRAVCKCLFLSILVFASVY